LWELSEGRGLESFSILVCLGSLVFQVSEKAFYPRNLPPLEKKLPTFCQGGGGAVSRSHGGLDIDAHSLFKKTCILTR